LPGDRISTVDTSEADTGRPTRTRPLPVPPGIAAPAASVMVTSTTYSPLAKPVVLNGASARGVSVAPCAGSVNATVGLVNTTAPPGARTTYEARMSWDVFNPL
jgi:hypothetical protein